MNRRSSDIYWLVGLLEGEGTFIIVKDKYPRISVEMTDLDIIQRARDIMDSSTNIRSRGFKGESHYKTQYNFSIEGQKAIEWMMTIYSLMGNRRKERIREIIQSWKAYESVSREDHNERISEGKRKSRMIKLIMMARHISYEEAEKILGNSLDPLENQTIN